MKEHPILFSTPMVKAILEGRKTMTRRVVKPQPENKLQGYYLNGAYAWRDPELNLDEYPYGNYTSCPYGQVGDRLWVRETWHQDTGLAGRAIHYKADGEAYLWKPSIFMPRRFSRITLEITNIRVERLQEITAGDCAKEGSYMATDKDDEGGFVNLWDSINSKTFPWSENPWVWVIEFEKV